MKTLSGKQFRQEFNKCELGFYLCEFNLLKEIDPLFPKSLGKQFRDGYKRKVEIWNENDVLPYVRFIAETERMKRDGYYLEINSLWEMVHPINIKTVVERINIRKTNNGFTYSSKEIEEKKEKLSWLLMELNRIKDEVNCIKGGFEEKKFDMHYFYMTIEIEKYLDDCSYYIYSVSKEIEDLIQCLIFLSEKEREIYRDLISKKIAEFYDDNETLRYLKECEKEGLQRDKKFLEVHKERILKVSALYNSLVEKITE